MDTAFFTSLGPAEMSQCRGGGFAYDAGRVLRFIGLTYHSAYGFEYARMDWEINKEINDRE